MLPTARVLSGEQTERWAGGFLGFRDIARLGDSSRDRFGRDSEFPNSQREWNSLGLERFWKIERRLHII